MASVSVSNFGPVPGFSVNDKGDFSVCGSVGITGRSSWLIAPAIFTQKISIILAQRGDKG